VLKVWVSGKGRPVGGCRPHIKVHHAIVNHTIVASGGMERACQSILSFGHDISALLSSAIHVDVQHRELHEIGD